MSLGSPILELRHLGKSFPGVKVLDGVDFELLRGEVHVLLGENGAGKSTLAKILSGACQKDSGEIRLDGKVTEIRNPRHAWALGIGMIYQELNLAPNLTVAENIFLGREYTLLPGVISDRQMRAQAQEIVDNLRVPLDVRARLGSLGIAQRQMVEIAKALSLHARILIMDEPTSALTGQEIRELFATMRGLKEQGVAIIYISHRLEELAEIGDRVTVLRDGHSVATRAVDEVEVSELIRLMVNRELKARYPRRRAARGAELLRVEHLTQKGRLHDISLVLHQGEVLGLAGLLGSGRSRLARTLFGAEPIDSGAIFLDGRPCRIDSPAQAIKLGIGFLAEDRRSDGLVLMLSLRENTSLPSLTRFCRWGVVKPTRERCASEQFRRQLRIRSQGTEQLVNLLSGGNQQKVVLSKWLCAQARLFIFDEPTRGIDVGAKVEIYELMNQLTAAGAGILMISSDMPEILGMSDRILTLCRGAITGELNAQEASQEAILRRALGIGSGPTPSSATSPSVTAEKVKPAPDLCEPGGFN